MAFASNIEPLRSAEQTLRGSPRKRLIDHLNLNSPSSAELKREANNELERELCINTNTAREELLERKSPLANWADWLRIGRSRFRGHAGADIAVGT